MPNLNVLIKEDKYSGEYVAIKSLEDSNVIAYGQDPIKVYEEAKSKKLNSPLIIKVPKKDMIQIL